MSAFATHRIAVALFAALTGLAQAQNQPAAGAPPAPFEPRPGQQGKDVIWLPTPQIAVDKMMELARVGPSDVVMDLGSGDGRTVITAAKLGARAMGIEYNPDMVEFATRNAEKAGVSNRTSFVKADLFETSFAEATVITMFLLTDINLKLRPKLLGLKPGIRVVSNTFTMGDWEPDERVSLQGNPGCENSYCTVLYWVVPQRVAGTYTVPQGEVTLKQEYQMLTGTLKTGGAEQELKGRVRGEDIELIAGNKQYRGRLIGNSLVLRDG